MLKEILKKESKIDPTQSSFVDSNMVLKFIGKEPRRESFVSSDSKVSTYLYEKTKERFFLINSKDVSFQMLTVFILKGVINVSDIVKIDGNYYSHEQRFNSIKSSKENSLAEIEADLFIIKIIFGDIDHVYYQSGRYANILKEIFDFQSRKENHNLLVNRLLKKHSFFDFKGTRLTLKSLMMNRESFEEQKIKFKTNLKDKKFGLGRLSQKTQHQVFDILRKKIAMLIYVNSDFQRFEKILQKSEMQLSEQEKKNLFENITNRFKALSEVLSEPEFSK